MEHARHQVAESGDGRVVKAGLGRGSLGVPLWEKVADP